MTRALVFACISGLSVIIGCPSPSADPTDGGVVPDGGLACDAGASSCGGDTPICVSNMCVACGGPGPSEACADLDGVQPICSESGACVECTDHDHCASQVCDRDASACVPEQQVIYVANGGFLGEDEVGEDTPGCGIPQRKCLTIGYAVDNRLDDDLGRTWVKIADGLYVENLVLANQAAQLIGGSEVRIEGATATVIEVNEGADLLVDRITVRAAGSPSTGIGCRSEQRMPSQIRVQRSVIARASGAGIDIESDCSAEIIESTVEFNGNAGIFLLSLSIDGTEALIIRRSEIENNGSVGIFARGGSVEIVESLISDNAGGGIELEDTDFLIRNDFIQNNGRAFTLEPSSVGGVKIQRDGPSQRIFEFNTVVYNEVAENRSISPGVACETVAPIEINNNIVWGNVGGNLNATDADAQISGFCDVSYSDVQGGVTPEGMLIAGTGNIDTDPLFVDPFRMNYRIEPESLAKDAADPEATLDVDFDGNPRPVGGGHDMGAHEVQ